MKRYVINRILLAILCIIGVSIIIFVTTRLSGDVTLLLLPQDATQQDYDNLRMELGLDKPIPVQYLVFLSNIAKGDFGDSTRYKRPAMGVVAERLPATMELAFTAFLISITFGILIGVLTAVKKDSWIDTFGKLFALLGQSMPDFWLAIMLIIVFSVNLHWLPSSGRGGIANLILPGITLGWFSLASIMRLTRSSMLDVMDSEYVKMARLKGNPEWIVIWKHALRNALIPVVTMGGLQLARLLGGVVIVETIFGWPGLGKLLVDAINYRDYSLVQAGVFITSTIFISSNLIVDLLYSVIDPRIRYK